MTWSCRLHFEHRDLWVGVYWKRADTPTSSNDPDSGIYPINSLHLYICLIPMFPIHLTFEWLGWEEGY